MHDAKNPTLVVVWWNHDFFIELTAWNFVGIAPSLCILRVDSTLLTKSSTDG